MGKINILNDAGTNKLSLEFNGTSDSTISGEVLSGIKANGITLPSLAADPASPESGQMYFNTVTQSVKTYDGVQWFDVGISFNDYDPFKDGSMVEAWKFEQNVVGLKGNIGTAVGLTYASVNSRPQDNNSNNGHAGYFGGDGDYVNWPTSLVPPADVARSYSFWLYVNNGATTRQLLWGTGKHGTGLGVFDIEANCYQSGVSDGYGIHWWGNGRKFSGNSTTRYGIWHHITVTHAGGNLGAGTKLYINGEFIGDLSAINQPFNTSSAITHQTGYRTAYNDLPVSGALDTMRQFNRELTSNEVSYLYSMGG